MRNNALSRCAIVVMVLLAALSGCAKKETKKDQPFDPKISMEQVDQLIDKKEYEEARKILLSIKNRDTTKTLAPAAQLKIADTYIREGEYDLGILEYQKFLELYPDNQYAYYAQYQIAMAYFNQIESPDRGSGAARKALEEFTRLKERYPRNPYRETVDLRIEKAKNTIVDGYFMIGQFYYKKESYIAAIQRFESVLKEYPGYKRADETLLLLGKSYRAMKYDSKAHEVFSLLIEKYPSSRFAAEAKKALR